MSEELLPCPFCGEQEYIEVEQSRYGGWFVTCGECGAQIGNPDEKEWALSAWNRRTLSKTETVKYLEIEAIKNDHSGDVNGMVEPVKDSYKLNEPLTLDELKQMDFEPVYVVDVYSVIRGWYVARDIECGLDLYRGGCHYASYNEYGKTWYAYRHKKEEGE